MLYSDRNFYQGSAICVSLSNIYLQIYHLIYFHEGYNVYFLWVPWTLRKMYYIILLKIGSKDSLSLLLLSDF